MRVLVTGANGFAGRHLVRHLREAGHTVFAAGHGAELSVDFRIEPHVEAVVAHAAPDAIVHLAGTSVLAEMLRDPTGGNENVLGPAVFVLRHAGRARVVLVSPAEVYGRGPTHEDAPLRPVDVFAAARASVEYVARQAQKDGRDVVVARVFPHTGPGQDRRFPLGDAAARHRAGEPVLPVAGPDVVRDVSDVRDVAAAYALLAERGASGGVYNVCSGEAWTLRALVERMCPGARVEPAPDARPSGIASLRGQATRLEALGWTRRFPLDTTLRDLLDSVPVP